ncbi:TetR/AcrR family transcriptional regulator [Nonomuraea sp. PA05]|uniref:TetR/AcrR family transcriptional regulator n=1 Tax=Nonomuraea sp. PA05 TaxID=2604466 RepID=UPI0021CCB906|nr:TetR-like C-terminal domain-containing protein [Nonomuraea sp. PA05]
MPVPQTSDPRVHRSRSALEAALLELLQDHELARVSVLDLTRRAGVNRSTFYEHYDSVGDLAAGACAALFDELITAAPVLGGRPQATGDEEEERAAAALTAIFTHVAGHARLYRALAGDHGSAHVMNHMQDRLAIAIHVNFHRDRHDDSRTHADDPSAIAHSPEAAFFAGALLGAVLDWLRRGCPCPPAQMSAAIWPLLRGAAGAVPPAGPA